MRQILFLTFCLSCLVGCSTLTSSGVKASTRETLRLPALFDDDAILQRETPIPVWGHDAPGQLVTVTLNGASRTGLADSEGKWRVDLPAMDAGGPHSMRISGTTTRVLRNILIGDVWVCSGQSNMEWPLTMSDNDVATAAEAGDSKLRLFAMVKTGAFEPAEDVRASWVEDTPENTLHFSAVAQHFGRELRATQDIPIGLIQAAWGGSSAQSWTPPDVLAGHPEHADYVAHFADRISPETYREDREEYIREMKGWLRKVTPLSRPDRGVSAGWHLPGYDDTQWDAMPKPERWETWDLSLNGYGWYRKTVELPDEWEGRDLVLSLGMVDDMDETWFNGVPVGATGLETEYPFSAKRRYVVPAGVAHGGSNTIAVRVLDASHMGGLHGPERLYFVAPMDNPSGERATLDGLWRFREESRFRVASPPGPSAPEFPTDHTVLPGFAWNGMIEPLLPFAMTGVIWYQGESNAGEPFKYRTLFPLMISAWRDRWGRGDFPWICVQLAPFGLKENERRSYWAEQREAQAAARDAVPNVAIVGTMDVGNCGDIHPTNKAPVGHRLALAARAMVYGEDIPWQSPEPEHVEFEAGRAVVHFAHAYDGLAFPDEKKAGFLIAGADQVFRPAEAVIEDSVTVILSHDRVPEPVAVRYGWADCPTGHLANSDGLPALPFRTDRWQKAFLIHSEP